MKRKLFNKYAHSVSHYRTKVLLKLEKLIDKWEDATNTDTAIFLKRPGKAIWANIVIGISRGVGFVIGVSIVGGIVIAILGKFLDHFVTLPIIGKFIAMIVEHVQQYLKNNNP